ncbi:MAG: tetratricopeptide repeat protein [Acidobacteria bacterium]|nr:tetratricopeptide repeat protein [Acidobacteriota bacterium]
MKLAARSFLLLVILGGPLLAAAASSAPEKDKQIDARAKAYYHFSLGYLYESLAGNFSRSEYLSKAIEQYKEALKYDPGSAELTVQLAEAYRRSGRIREAVLEAKQLLADDPDNIAAHRLLGRIYFQTLGDLNAPGTPQQTLGLAIEEYEHITRLDPQDAEALLDLARLYRLANDLPKAEAALKKLLAQEPQSEVALAALASIYSDAGDYEKAVKLLAEATSQTDSARLLGSLGYAYEQAGNYENAIQSYRRALQYDADNLELRRRLAETLLTAERIEEALAEYKVLAEADPEDAQSFLRLAQIYRHQRRYDDARQALERAKQLDPDDLELGFQEALLEEAQGRFDAAIAVLSHLVARMTRASGQYSQEETRSRSLVLEKLGLLYRDVEKFDEAVEVFEMMLPLDEEAARRGYHHLTDTLRQARRYEPARSTVQQALERFPGDRNFTIQLALLHSDQGELDAALALLDSLLSESPDDRAVHLTRAQIYERHKRWPEAEQAVAEAEKLSRSPAELEGVYFMRGALFERQKKYDLAEEQFRKTLELDPDSAITLNYLGYMFADQNMKLEESVELIQRALELEPHNGAYLDSLGWAYFRLNKFDLAEDYLLRAVNRLSRDPTIHDHLGDLYFKTGRLELAVQAWERALEEWKQTPQVEFDAEAVARLEEKLHSLKVRLAKETQKQIPKPSNK